MKIHNLVAILILSVFTLVSCNKTNNKTQETIIVDSPSERAKQALKIIEHYSMDEWENDIIIRVSNITGSDVSEEVRSEVRRTLSDQELLNKRVSLMTEIYTAEELANLANLYSTIQGRSLLKKIIVHEQRLRDIVSPVVIEVMSNFKK